MHSHDDVLLEEEAFRIRTTCLDHQISCLAFALEEKQHLSIWKNRLQELGLSPGPWLQDLKRAVLARQPDNTPIRVSRRKEGGMLRASLRWRRRPIP